MSPTFKPVNYEPQTARVLFCNTYLEYVSPICSGSAVVVKIVAENCLDLVTPNAVCIAATYKSCEVSLQFIAEGELDIVTVVPELLELQYLTRQIPSSTRSRSAEFLTLLQLCDAKNLIFTDPTSKW